MNHLLPHKLFYIYCDGEYKETFRGTEQDCLHYVDILCRYFDNKYYIINK